MGWNCKTALNSLDAIDLQTGKVFTLNAAQCAFGYRDSVFKHGTAAARPDAAATEHQRLGLKDRALILRVRLALPKVWKPVLGYADIEKKMAEHACPQPTRSKFLTGCAPFAAPSCPTRR
jgi:UDP-N-acetylmuramate dehydrogenase